jgi:hypothetical protein
MQHDYFNEFRDWFDDEIQTLIEYDNQEQYPQPSQKKTIIQL